MTNISNNHNKISSLARPNFTRQGDIGFWILGF